MTTRLAWVFFLCTLASSAPAGAAYVYVKETGTGAGQSANLTLPVGTGNYFAGFQNVAISPNGSGVPSTGDAAFCVDPSHFSSGSYLRYVAPAGDNVAAVFGSARATNIENLFDLY